MADAERPVTKQELDAALNAAMGGLREWIAGRLQDMTERIDELAERIEAKETQLLTAFHRYAEVNHNRISKVEGEQHVDGDRLTKLERRVQSLEERLDFPNQPRTH